MQQRSGMRFEVQELGARKGRMLIVGLTGGIGSGKSTVAERFRVMGVPVIDADEVAREVVEPGQPALAHIVETFGAEVLDADGRLDRGKLRRLVFADPERRKVLEGILHPLIRKEMRQRTQKIVAPYCILSIPLLIEAGQRDMVDRVLVVDAPEELQIQRARARDGLSAEDVQAVMSAQVDKQTRLAAADDVVVNDQGLDELYAQVDALHQRYLQLADQAHDEGVSQDTPTPRATAAEAKQPDKDVEPPRGAPKNKDREYVVYELPLNERIRTFLRLECLFQQAGHHLRGENRWDSRAAVGVLLDLLEAFSRVDVKKDLLQEMERLTAALNRFVPRQGVNKTRLEAILGELNGLFQDVHAINGPIGQSLRQHEMLSGVKQRAASSGSICSFDLPVYYHWLNRPANERRDDLTAWFQELEPLRRAVDFVLELIRGSASPSVEEAKAGFYQQSLDTAQPYQLIQVNVPVDASYYVEISGGRHRFSVRLMQPQGENRAVQINDDVKFRLNCCAI